MLVQSRAVGALVTTAIAGTTAIVITAIAVAMAEMTTGTDIAAVWAG